MTEKVTKAKIRDQIDENLRQIYHEIAKEEVPERFRLLLEQLQRKSDAEGGAADQTPADRDCTG